MNRIKQSLCLLALLGLGDGLGPAMQRDGGHQLLARLLQLAQRLRPVLPVVDQEMLQPDQFLR